MGDGPGAKGTTPKGRRETARETETQGRAQTKGAAGAKRPGRGNPVPALCFAFSLLALGRPDGRCGAGICCLLVGQLLSQIAFQLVHGDPHLPPAKIPIFAGPPIVSPGPEVNPGPGKGLTGDPWTPSRAMWSRNMLSLSKPASQPNMPPAGPWESAPAPWCRGHGR